MTARQLRERLSKQDMKVIEESPFPSTQLLDRVETSLSDRDALADYAEMLVKKVEDTRFPSTQLLKRIDETLARLEQQERLEAARGDDGTTESG